MQSFCIVSHEQLLWQFHGLWLDVFRQSRMIFLPKEYTDMLMPKAGPEALLPVLDGASRDDYYVSSVTAVD